MLKANKIAKAQRINRLRFNYSLYSEREEEKKYDISLYCLRFNYSKKKKKKIISVNILFAELLMISNPFYHHTNRLQLKTPFTPPKCKTHNPLKMI